MLNYERPVYLGDLGLRKSLLVERHIAIEFNGAGRI